MTAHDLSAVPDEQLMARLRAGLAQAPETELLAAADTLERITGPVPLPVDGCARDALNRALNAAAPPREYRIEIPPRTILLNANDRPNHYKRARIVKNLRTIAHQLAVIRRIPHLECVEITGFVHPPDKRDRDPHNWYPTLKAAIDGIRDAGVITDDTARYLVRTDMRLGEKTRFLSFSLLIREAL